MGGSKKKGEHSILRQHMGLGIRAINPETANKKSALWQIFQMVKPIFLKWRMSGQYVDKFDLLVEFEHQCKIKLAELELKKNEQGGMMHSGDAKLWQAAVTRLSAHEKKKRGTET